ncbi:MAG: short chain dehydrogenase [Alphaproteobacteria bacterium]|nr:short chain dehydrogenase [Alphaproteobacteria bacterium]|tara:strand:+ start:622 stop:1419 length:798 start_codon:yes stop_codon:yes gene_type:complete
MNATQTSSIARGLEPGVALVTGGGQRIGRAICDALAEEGWAIAIHYLRSSAEADELAEEIEARGGNATTISADLAHDESAKNLITRASSELGPVTCLINNASVFEPDDVLTATADSWQRHLDINLRAPFFLTQSFALALEKGEPGCVINILDERVWNLTPYFSSYTVSKMGLWTLTQTCALALAPNIRVNAVGPGPTLPSPRQSSEHFSAQIASTPLGIGTTPVEIGSAVKFILESPAMTGQMIALDGGQHLKWRRYPDDTDLVE